MGTCTALHGRQIKLSTYDSILSEAFTLAEPLTCLRAAQKERWRHRDEERQTTSSLPTLAEHAEYRLFGDERTQGGSSSSLFLF